MKRTLLIYTVLAVFIAVFASCSDIGPVEISYSTQQSETPATIDWTEIGLAKELVNMKDMGVVVSGGDNPIPTEEWDDFKPRYPWQKNIDRLLLFDSTCLYRSPDVSADCLDCYTTIDYQGYTWLELAKVYGVAYVPSETDYLEPEEGYLVIKTIQKCQLVFYKSGDTIYELTDNKGNFYIMHATENGEPTLNVVLPTGWTLTSKVISEDLIIAPFGGGDYCYYNIVGDHLGQGYHQYIYADDVYPSIEEQ